MFSNSGRKEARALQLLAEVDRQEQEYRKLRQEKEQLHRAAMEAWHKGDVSNALSKLGVVLELDRKAPDSINRESGTNYQSFYNEVRSEHDAINTAYAEARRHLTEHNFSRALLACQQYLIKISEQRDFSGAEVRHRRAAAARTFVVHRLGRSAGGNRTGSG
jgi:hypothetical protein